MKFTNPAIRSFACLNAQLAVNKNRNAVRFESQNLSWDYELAHYHSTAFAKGLKAVGIHNNHCLLIKISPSQQAEAYVAKVATEELGSRLVLSTANTVEELDQEISQNKVTAVIFEPTLALEDNSLIDGIYQLMPEARNCKQGSQLSTIRYSSLKMLIQTNFYTYPGVYKYRSIFNYASERFCPLERRSSHDPIQVPESKNPLIITQPTHDFAFRAGILNSLVNDRYVVCVQANEVARIARIHDNKVDLVATQDCSSNDQMQILVPKGSQLFQGHANRSEI